MRIRLQHLSSPSFELKLPDKSNRERVLAIDHISGLSGVLERSAEVLSLRSATLDECQVTGVSWPFPSGSLVLGTPAAVSGLELDGDIALVNAPGAFVLGRAAVALIDAEEVRVALGGHGLSADLRIEDLAARSDEDDAGTALSASVASLGGRNLQTALGGLLCRVGGVGLQGARLSWRRTPQPDGHEAAASVPPPLPEVHVDALSIVEATTTGRGIEVHADQIELPRGVELAGGALRFERLRIGQLTVSIDDLSALAPPPGRPDGAEPPSSDAAQGADPKGENGALDLTLSELVDLAFLDRLGGKIDVDMTVDADVPIIGTRRGYHCFRLPIANGALNYRQLERGLSALEDAVLDFEVRDHLLVLERDIPIIGMEKDLVRWHLDDRDYALARESLVRLRTLPSFAIPEPPGNSSVEFRKLSIDELDVELATSYPEPGDRTEANSPGAVSEVHIGQSRITGTFSYPADQPRAICVTAEALTARLRGLRLDRLGSLSGQISIERVADVRLCFDGLRPHSLALTLHGIELCDAIVELTRPST